MKAAFALSVAVLALLLLSFGCVQNPYSPLWSQKPAATAAPPAGPAPGQGCPGTSVDIPNNLQMRSIHGASISVEYNEIWGNMTCHYWLINLTSQGSFAKGIASKNDVKAKAATLARVHGYDILPATATGPGQNIGFATSTRYSLGLPDALDASKSSIFVARMMTDTGTSDPNLNFSVGGFDVN